MDQKEKINRLKILQKTMIHLLIH